MKYIIYYIIIFLIIPCHAQIITTIAGTGTSGYTGDGGLATAASMRVEGIARDRAGNIYITDFDSSARKINTSGIITRFAGSDSAGYSGDGGPATLAKMKQPAGLAIDSAGNVYITDWQNNRVRKVDTFGIITTYAGGGSYYCHAGDGMPATACALSGVQLAPWIDNGGNMYFTSTYGFYVCKVNSSGIIKVVAGYCGLSGSSGDGGPATGAFLFEPGGIAVDSAGNIYFGDQAGKIIRKIDTGGIITTFAGADALGYSGDGGPATAAKMRAGYLAFDRCGNLLLNDSGARIRKIDAAGIITTIAGTTGYGYSGDGGPATAAQFTNFSQFNIDCVGNTYIADGTRIREILYPNKRPYFAGGETQPLTICWGAGAVSLDTLMAIIDSDCGQTETWSVLSPPVNGTLVASYSANSNTGTVTPSGLTYTPTMGYSGMDSFSVIISDCGNLSDTTKVIVTLGAPIVRAITGDTADCISVASVLTDTIRGGIWSSSATSIATISAGGAVTGVTTGSTTISYTVTNSCGTTTATQAITVNPLPDAGSITGAGSVCAGAGISLTETATGGSWSSSATGIATVGAVGAVTGVAAGTATITYSVTNTCGTATATDNITVNALPVAGSIAGAGSVCAGATISLTDTASGGVWSATATSVATISASGTVTGVATGSTTISYTVTNSCGVATATQAVTVNPLPDAGGITGAGSVCAGAVISLTETASGGSWSSGATGIATVSGTGNVTGVAAGTAAISYSVTNSCGMASAIDDITVNVIPSAGAITGANHICVGNTATLTDAATGGSWGSGTTSIASINSTGELTGIAVGTAVISYSVSGICGTGYAFDTLTVTPYVTGTITGRDNVCTGATITLTDTASGGTWLSGSTYVATVTSSGIVTGVNAGVVIITYSYTNMCGAVSVEHSVTVDAYADPGTISGPTHACVGTPVTLTASASSPDWRATNGNATVSSSGVVTGIEMGVDTIEHIFSNACGLSSATFVDTIDRRVAFSALGTRDTICEGDTLILSKPVPGGYFFSSNSSASITANGKITAETPGYDTITYAVINGCGSSEAVLVLTINPDWLCDLSVNSTIRQYDNVTISPNPNDGSFVLTISSAVDEEVQVVVTNLLGQREKEQVVLTNRDNEVQLSVPAGVYFLSAVTGSGRVTVKVVVE